LAYGQLRENMTSSTKPEVQNVWHCCHRKTELWPHVQIILWNLDMWFLRYASVQTHRQRETQYLSPVEKL